MELKVMTMTSPKTEIIQNNRMKEMRAKRAKQAKLRQLRIRVVALTASVIAVTILICLIINGQIKQREYDEKLASYEKYYGQMYVGRDVTVWDMYDEVCAKYADTSAYERADWMMEVAFINHLNYDYEITYGEYIVVPYFNGTKELAE